MSTLVWVAVPASLSSPATARIRVLVVPQLGGVSLAEFGLQDWPALLAGATFELQVKSDDGVHEVDRAPDYQPVADSDAWHAFFDGDAGRIEAWTPKQVAAPHVSPTYSDARAVVTAYRECTSILTDPPADGEDAVRQRIDRWSSPLSPPVQVEDPLPPLPPPTDFHRTVATLREHPAVMEALGLVFELTVPVGDLNVGTGPRFLRVRGSDLPVDIASPWTKYDLDPGEKAFWPAPADVTSGIRRGLLDLEDVGLLDFAEDTTPRWALSTLDVDGAVRALGTEVRALDGDSERPAALPDLRTGGLMLIRPDRQSDFTARAEVAANRLGAALGDAELTAEDLVLGYRVDIRTEDNDWLSLSERRATYTVVAADGRTIPLGEPDRLEEGHIAPYAAVKTPDGRLQADEVVIRWTGWGLAAPPVDLLSAGSEAQADPQNAPPYDFRWSFGPPIDRLPDGRTVGRLPRLRFANSYQMRVRIADLTGGGPGLTDPGGTDGATDTVVYTRNDPIRPPRLSRDGTGGGPGGGPDGGEFAAGAAIDKMVIRSDRNTSVAAFVAAHPQYPAVERRGIHPPTAGFALTEQHMEFDPDPDDPEDSRPEFTERTWKLALRALRAEAAGDPVGALLDPATSGVSAHIRPAPGGLAESIIDRTAWRPRPLPKSKHVELSEHPARTPPVTLKWDGDQRLDIKLARGKEAVLELSSTVRNDFLDHFALTTWLERPIDAPGIPHPPLEKWRAIVRNGLHPLLSPVQRIHLVHAVRRPLVDPMWQLPTTAVVREQHDTNVVLKPTFETLGLDTDSTGRLEVSATWNEVVGDGSQEQRVVDCLFGTAIDRGEPPEPQIRHEFGDTKHRKVAYTLKAISRFRAYFDRDDPAEAFQSTLPQPVVIVPSSAQPPDLTLLSTTPSFRWQSGTTADRIERSRSSRRLRIELAGPWFETGEGERLAVLVADEAGTPTTPVTRIGRDPVFASPPLPLFPAKSWFAGFSEPPLAPASPSTLPPHVGPGVWLVPYAVVREGDCWYADIEITPPQPAPSYSPFVRLALARLQPHSLPKLSLSSVVISDPVRLLPDRSLTVERTGPNLRVSLLGPGPNPANNLEVALEEAHVPAGVAPGAIDLVDVTDPPAADIPAWRRLSSAPRGRADTPVTLRLPVGTAPLRLRVREVEEMDGPASTAPAELRERTVFVDTVPLPSAWRPN
ncbi:hypothetical protein ACIGW1_31885 [Streptomyces sp. NPDC053780]|uniref:hypothetical protein n=1 Tax=unclassified Streptomyces TaxID=2593676 RepID=UPI003425E650